MSNTANPARSPFGLAKGQTLAGNGRLSTGAINFEARYEIAGNGRHDGVRGCLWLTPDEADDAFRSQPGWLTLENGQEYAILMRAHTAGTERIFFEMHRLER